MVAHLDTGTNVVTPRNPAQPSGSSQAPTAPAGQNADRHNGDDTMTEYQKLRKAYDLATSDLDAERRYGKRLCVLAVLYGCLEDATVALDNYIEEFND